MYKKIFIISFGDLKIAYFDKSKPRTVISGSNFFISSKNPLPQPTSKIKDLLVNLYFLINFTATGFQ